RWDWLAIILVNGGRVAAQWLCRNFHERKQRKGADKVMQLLDVLDIENADVRVLPGNAPEVAPLALALELLRSCPLHSLQLIGTDRVKVVGDANIHANMKQHEGQAPVAVTAVPP